MLFEAVLFVLLSPNPNIFHINPRRQGSGIHQISPSFARFMTLLGHKCLFFSLFQVFPQIVPISDYSLNIGFDR